MLEGLAQDYQLTLPAILRRELVDEKRWVSEGQYLRTLNFCMLLPGPEAQQVATYIGILVGSYWFVYAPNRGKQDEEEDQRQAEN